MTTHARLARIARQVLRERYASIEDQADAMSAAVITELGLTQEERIAPGSKIELANEYGLPVAKRIADIPLQFRLVTPWADRSAE